MRIRAISLDLDDTLWPIEPVIKRAEQHMDSWLQAECPQVATAWPLAAMRELRECVMLQHPELGHDFTALRKLTLRRVFAPFALGEEWVERAYLEYFAARNEVDFYEDVLPALERLVVHVPLVSISNGNADLERIGLRTYFKFSVSAREFGIAKPHPSIFHAACERLGFAPHEVLHVGDDAELDVIGAHTAGMRSAWINRQGAAWSYSVHTPDLQLRNLGELAEWLERHRGDG